MIKLLKWEGKLPCRHVLRNPWEFEGRKGNMTPDICFMRLFDEVYIFGYVFTWYGCGINMGIIVLIMQ